MRPSRKIHSFTSDELRMAGKADCECPDREHDGIPCEHDLALLSHIEKQEEIDWEKFIQRFCSLAADAR